MDRIDEIINVELNGLISTINDYTKEHFIRNYTSLLQNISYPEDKHKLKLIIGKLLEWYDKNLEDILEHPYLRNKHEHQKSSHILKEMYCILDLDVN